MKTSITVFCCYCACWAVEESSSFLTARGAPPATTGTGGRAVSPTAAAAAAPESSLLFSAATRTHGHPDTTARHRRRRQTAPSRPCRPSTVAVMAAAEASTHANEAPGNDSSGCSVWLRKVAASTVVAASVLAGVCVGVPADAVAAKPPKQEPVVQALVQLADEEADWTTLLSDAGQAPGANMLITASKNKGGPPSLGASIAMERLRFPVMMQLFPRNAIGGASWPGDFEEKGTYAVEVVVCGSGKVRGGGCESPLPIVGSGESIFVTGVEDVPEIAESGGMRVPATIILTAPSARILAPL